MTRLSTTCPMEHVIACSAMTSQVQHVLKADALGMGEIAQSWGGVAT